MTRRRWVAYVGTFMFPEGEASSRRVYGLANTIITSGYDVIVGCGDAKPEVSREIYCDVNGRTLSYIGLAERPHKHSSSMEKVTRWIATLGRRTVAWLDTQPTKPSHVIYYGTSVAFLLRVMSWCRRNTVPLIVDVVEWHDPWSMWGGVFSPVNMSDKASLRFLIPRASGVIAISTFLEKYYRARRCRVVRVPTTLDTCQIRARLADARKGDNKLVLAYAGKPGKGRKDLINSVIEAVLRVNSLANDVHLVIVGPTPGEILKLPALVQRNAVVLPRCIEAHGRQTPEKALDVVRSADFMPLLRPLKRFTEAGFPTKVPESLVVGTPVICNLTSDLRDYIHDGAEGLVCGDPSWMAFAHALKRALKLSRDQRTAMRQAARMRAEESFDYRVYADPMRCFLERVSCS